MLKTLTLLALLTTAVVACSSSSSSSSPSPSPARAPQSTAHMPFAIERLTDSFEGAAQEVLQVSGYTYVAVDTGAGVRWAVSLHKEIDEGAHVRVIAFGKKQAFESKKLGRTFDELWFAIVTLVPANEPANNNDSNEGDRS